MVTVGASEAPLGVTAREKTAAPCPGTAAPPRWEPPTAAATCGIQYQVAASAAAITAYQSATRSSVLERGGGVADIGPAFGGRDPQTYGSGEPGQVAATRRRRGPMPRAASSRVGSRRVASGRAQA